MLSLASHRQHQLRPFYLHRYEDASGVSGTGIVALGVVLPSGKAVMEWCSPWKTLTVFDSVTHIERIHGHGGQTVLRWGLPASRITDRSNIWLRTQEILSQMLKALRHGLGLKAPKDADEPEDDAPRAVAARPAPIPLRRGKTVASRYYRQ